MNPNSTAWKNAEAAIASDPIAAALQAIAVASESSESATISRDDVKGRDTMPTEIVKPMRPLTENQKAALKALVDHNDGIWTEGCGWQWTNPSGTVKLLDALVKRGLATKTERPRWGRYGVTDVGRAQYDIQKGMGFR